MLARARQDAKKAKTDSNKKKGGKRNEKQPKFEETMDATVAITTSATRDKLWLDDLVCALLAPLACLKHDQINKKAVSQIALDGLSFMLVGVISLNGKELKSLASDSAPTLPTR